MAADNTSNPWTVAAADVAAGPVILWAGQAHIYQVEFQAYAGDTDECTINQTNGKIFWYGNGAADRQTVRSGGVGWANGIVIPINGITSGFVRIYHK
jgi:hypothetical protein